MVWIISQHYNTDSRMVPLMERIAWLVSDKVHRAMDPRTILKRPTEEVKELCRQVTHLLKA